MLLEHKCDHFLKPEKKFRQPLDSASDGPVRVATEDDLVSSWLFTDAVDMLPIERVVIQILSWRLAEGYLDLYEIAGVKDTVLPLVVR